MAAGIVAGALLLPLPSGPFGSGGEVLMIGTIICWVTAMALWTHAFGQVGPERARQVGLTGLLLAGGSLLAGAEEL